MGQYSSTLAAEAAVNSEKRLKIPSDEKISIVSDKNQEYSIPKFNHNLSDATAITPSDYDSILHREFPQDVVSRHYFNTTPTSIVDLSKEEIQNRLDKLNLTMDAFLNAHKKGLSQVDDGFSWYYNKSSENQRADVDNLHMNIALYILSISPSVRIIRFKLVPSRLSENKFWRIMFDFICYGPDGHFERLKDDLDLPRNGNHSQYSSEGTLQNTIHVLKTKIQNQEEEIQKLRMKLIELENEKRSQTDEIECSHIGNWIMDKESLEFLNLDMDIKEKLREGKLKRIQEVNEQMKFILDSDNVEDSRGKWDCCGQMFYSSQCLCK